MVYLGLANKSTSYVNQLFTRISDVHNRNTRSSAQNLLTVPRTRLECSKGNMKVRGPVYFNKLPEDIRQAGTVECFKNKLKRQEQ